MSDFGPQLKALREARAISQSQLAKRAAFDHSYVSRLESGERMPTRDAVDRLALALGLARAAHGALLAAGGFLPDDLSILYTYPELAQLDGALATCPDQQALSEALATLRTVIRALSPKGNMHRHDTSQSG